VLFKFVLGDHLLPRGHVMGQAVGALTFAWPALASPSMADLQNEPAPTPHNAIISSSQIFGHNAAKFSVAFANSRRYAEPLEHVAVVSGII
jgi:hypothetical protein